jgi:predicted membrane channel-forming protein YqfA (hemolysin III family)
MTLMMKSVLITAALGLLLIFYEWNMKRKQKEGISASDWRSLRDLVFLTIGACGLVAFGVWALA